MQKLQSLFAAVIGGTILSGVASTAHALEPRQCFAKSDQAKILSNAGQNRVIGAVTKTFLKDGNDNFIPTEMKVTYTSDKEQTSGFILLENGCEPSDSSSPLQPSDISVYVASRVRVTGIFNNRLNFIPLRSRSSQPNEASVTACNKIIYNRSHEPSDLEIMLPNYTHDLSEALSHNVSSPRGCAPLDTMLDNLKKHEEAVMFQGVIILDDGHDGPTITVTGKPDTTMGGVFLSGKDGAAIYAETFDKIVYLDNASTFLKVEQPYVPQEKTASLDLLPK